ncbi:MAG: SprT family zinc-dependent metalloprotease [Pseudomonadota bacterium]
MSLESRQIQYGQHVIVFKVERRERTTLEIAVEPDLSVKIAAPQDASNDDIDAKVRKRAAWIQRQKVYFLQFLPRTPERRFVSGETHRYLGRQYRLKIRLGLVDRVRLYRGFIDVETTRPKTPSHIRNLVIDWYKHRARVKFHERLRLSQERFAAPEAFAPQSMIIRQLRQRWGSMSPTNRLVLNTKLIEAPVDAIDYVITHELCHIEHRHHGPKFYDLLDRVMPDWRKRKTRLEQYLT